MAVEFLDSGSDEGTTLGQDADAKISFYGADPVAQPEAIADVTPAADGTTAGTALNALLAHLRTLGLIAS
jgi:hypothetical protein